MANDSVGAALNQFMVLLQGHPRTPVAPERYPRPDGGEQADEREKVAENARDDGVRKDCTVPIHYPGTSVEEDGRRGREHEVKQPVRQWPLRLRPFDRKGGDN